MKGFKVQSSYAIYDRDPSKVPYQKATDRDYQNGDTKQINIDSFKKLLFLKGVNLKSD